MSSEHKPKVLKYSKGLTKIIDQMTFWHKIHGTLVLTDDSSHTNTSISVKIVMRFSTFLTMVAIFCGGVSKISSNNQLQRLQNLSLSCVQLLIISQAVFLWLKRKDFYKIVTWCHWLETRPEKYCKTPMDWFVPTQNKISEITQ